MLVACGARVQCALEVQRMFFSSRRWLVEKACAPGWRLKPKNHAFPCLNIIGRFFLMCAMYWSGSSKIAWTGPGCKQSSSLSAQPHHIAIRARVAYPNEGDRVRSSGGPRIYHVCYREAAAGEFRTSVCGVSFPFSAPDNMGPP